MVDDEHVSEDLIELFGSIGVLLTLEEGNEHIVLPVIVKFVLILVDLVHLKDG